MIFDEAFKIAECIHPRAADAYFIATAKLTNSILITNDRIMVNNAKRYGIEAYYLIEDFDKAVERLKEVKLKLKTLLQYFSKSLSIKTIRARNWINRLPKGVFMEIIFCWDCLTFGIHAKVIKKYMQRFR